MAITKENGYPVESSQEGGPLSWFTPLMTNGTSQSVFNQPLKSEISVVSGKVINTPLEPDVDFADTPYREQSEISKTVNYTQEDEEIDFSDSPANLDIEGEGFLLDSDPGLNC